MKREMLIRLCDKFHMLKEYPLAVFCGTELVYSCGYSLEYSGLPVWMRTEFRDGQEEGILCFPWEKRQVIVVYFPVLYTDLSVLLGPFLTAEAREKGEQREQGERGEKGELEAENLRQEYFRMSDTERKLLAGYLRKAYPVKEEEVIHYSDFFYMAVNQRVPDWERTFADSEGMTDRQKIDGRPVESPEVFYSEENERYVEKLEYLIRNGLTEKLDEFITGEHEFPYGKLGPNLLRHQKNSCIVSVYIVRKAAQAGGLDEQLCLRLAEGYTQRFELAGNTSEVYQISKEMMRDYCRRVRELKKLHAHSPGVGKAAKYIHDHRMEKLDIYGIAEKVGISYSYLCSRFKKETGMSITAFVRKEKTDAAKELLLFSELSLGEIAEYLSFSSQSYFQTVFKKTEHCTPAQYRLRENLP